MTDKAALFANYWQILAPNDPPPVAEHRFAPPRRWRFDFAWPDQMVAVEVDGGQWAAQGGRHARDTDREKMNAAAVMGWRVLRFSPDMLSNDPVSCIGLVRACLKLTEVTE
jgi:very-short-patch-repair endonuclease